MLERLLNKESHRSTRLALSEVRDSVTHKQKINNWTHNLYKYPACFPPSFPKAVINSFSKIDDWILDPFVGGGTCAVEAMVARRNFVGTDINELAVFSAELKTTLISKGEASKLLEWASALFLNDQEPEYRAGDEIYFTNIPKIIELSTRKISSAIRVLPTNKLRNFAKGALLRLGQLEVEQRLLVKTIRQAEEIYKQTLSSQIDMSFQLYLEFNSNPVDFIPSTHIRLESASEPNVTNEWKTSRKPFSLVVTSPPYPERHILYNKWQVNGRLETRLPYWIIDSNQIESEPFYTMGSRDGVASLEIYITNMMLAFENLNKVMEKNGVFVQVLAFNNLKDQLPLYLSALNETGFEEIRNIDTSSPDGRLWREVPNRKWFNRTASSDKCKEVVLFHRKKRSI
ncbi:MAG: site-specific DNA-methyltransferase [Bdellovibrionaceae bacterium]|nr:site-specific DNA-methyltransferase [Pseudobdellovibrionaceae bacterium]